MNRKQWTAANALSAVAAALVGRWAFGQPSVIVAILIGLAAAIATMIVVELLDGPPSRRETLLPPPTSTPPAPPTNTASRQTASPGDRVPAPTHDMVPSTPVPGSSTTSERYYQCPTCGGFDVVRTGEASRACGDCHATWVWRAPAPWPRVTIDVRARSGARR